MKDRYALNENGVNFIVCMFLSWQRVIVTRISKHAILFIGIIYFLSFFSLFCCEGSLLMISKFSAPPEKYSIPNSILHCNLPPPSLLYVHWSPLSSLWEGTISSSISTRPILVRYCGRLIFTVVQSHRSGLVAGSRSTLVAYRSNPNPNLNGTWTYPTQIVNPLPKYWNKSSSHVKFR